jgi:hypothetical protein
LISFKTIFIKLYFRFKTINNNKLNKLKALLFTLKLILEFIKPAEPIILLIIKCS